MLREWWTQVHHHLARQHSMPRAAAFPAAVRGILLCSDEDSECPGAAPTARGVADTGKGADMSERTWVHRLSDLDPDARTAVCANCGPVQVKRRAGRNGGDRWSCRVAERGWSKGDPASTRRRWDKFARGSGEASPRDQFAWKLAGYGLTFEQFSEIVLAQGGLCAVCDEQLQVPNIDHDHRCCPRAKSSCGSCVRGLLCRRCNLGLGHFRDSRDWMERAIRYLSS